MITLQLSEKKIPRHFGQKRLKIHFTANFCIEITIILWAEFGVIEILGKKKATFLEIFVTNFWRESIYNIIPFIGIYKVQNLLTKTPLVYGTTKKYIILIWGVYCCIYPASAGYILYISRSCGIYIIYIPWDIYFYIYPRKPSKWDIYYIYGTLSWYMQQHTPETETFFHPRIQYTPSTSAFFVLGLRPRTKNASVSGVYCSSDEKMPRFRGYVVAYTTTKYRIYNIYPI